MASFMAKSISRLVPSLEVRKTSVISAHWSQSFTSKPKRQEQNGKQLQRRIHAISDRNRMVFKVSKVSFDDGSMETINLHSSELVANNSISFRDLFFTLNLTSKTERKTQNRSRRSSSCAILPRKDWIVVSFGNTIRAMIGLDSVLLFDAHNPAVQSFGDELVTIFSHKQIDPKSSSSSHGEEPNELVVLEHIIRDTVDAYQRRLRLFEPVGKYTTFQFIPMSFSLSTAVYSFLDMVDNHDFSSPDAANSSVHQLSPLKDSLQSFKIQVSQSEECLEQLLQQDDTMLSLLLTEQRTAATTGQAVELARHEHVEILLGVYAREISHVNETIAYLLQRIQSKQEFVALSLSGYRNRMIRLNVLVGIAGLSLGLSTAVAGFFGMNLVSGLEDSPFAFGTVVTLAAASSVAVSTGCLAFLSGSKLRHQAAIRMQETERLTRALNIMSSLDHTMKVMLEESENEEISQEQFREMLKSDKVAPSDADMLFSVFDRIKDGNLTARDFQPSNRRL